MRIKYINKDYILDFFNVVLILYVTISSIYPPLRVFFNNTLVNTISIFFWFLFSFYRAPSFYFKKNYNYLIFIIIFYLYSFFIPYFFNKEMIGNRYLNLLPVFFLQIVYDFNIYINKNKNNLLIIFFSLPFIVITLVRTMIGLSQNPYLSRTLISEGFYSMVMYKKGYDGYGFIYFLVIIMPVLVHLIFFSNIIKSKSLRLGLIFFTLASFYLILLSNYFLAIIISIFSFVLMLIIEMYRVKKLIAVIVLISLIIIFSNTSLLVIIIDFLKDILPSGKNVERLNLLEYSIVVEKKLVFEKSRFDLIKVSLNSFFNNPIFGLVQNNSVDILNAIYSSGQHSQIFDTFAFLGFLPGILQIYLLIKLFALRNKNKKLKSLTIPFFFSVLMIFAFDNVTPSIGFALGLIFPFIYDKNFFNQTQNE